MRRILDGAFGAVGADPRIGARLPALFADAGLGAPDGTDVAGRLLPLAEGEWLLRQTLTSLGPAAVAHGVVASADDVAAVLADLELDVAAFPDRPLLHPLMIGAWKRKPHPGEPS